VSKFDNDVVKKKDQLEDVCLVKAIQVENDDGKSRISIDNGKCFLCGRCNEIYPDIFEFKNDFKDAARVKHELIESFNADGERRINLVDSGDYEQVGLALKERIYHLFGKSLAIREVDAGSCNGCEIEITALNNPIYDIERFGIKFVSSPRHADVLLVTGPVTRNMKIALEKTFEATPDPKIVIAVGACACSGGIFGNNYATSGGVDNVIPVDVYIPGCPPKPEALIYGIWLSINKTKV